MQGSNVAALAKFRIAQGVVPDFRLFRSSHAHQAQAKWVQSRFVHGPKRRNRCVCVLPPVPSSSVHGQPSVRHLAVSLTTLALCSWPFYRQLLGWLMMLLRERCLICWFTHFVWFLFFFFPLWLFISFSTGSQKKKKRKGGLKKYQCKAGSLAKKINLKKNSIKCNFLCCTFLVLELTFGTESQ